MVNGARAPRGAGAHATPTGSGMQRARPSSCCWTLLAVSSAAVVMVSCSCAHAHTIASPTASPVNSEADHAYYGAPSGTAAGVASARRALASQPQAAQARLKLGHGHGRDDRRHCPSRCNASLLVRAANAPHEAAAVLLDCGAVILSSARLALSSGGGRS